MHPGASPDHTDALMIYPNSAKDVATSLYPYAELLRDFSSSISRPQSVLVTYGYGFGDEHVNRVILDMLTVPSTHLVIISWDSADGRIERFFRTAGSDAQISLLIGSHFADLMILARDYLPKPAIDVISNRMNEMLRKRIVLPQAEGAQAEAAESQNGGT